MHRIRSSHLFFDAIKNPYYYPVIARGQLHPDEGEWGVSSGDGLSGLMGDPGHAGGVQRDAA